MKHSQVIWYIKTKRPTAIGIFEINARVMTNQCQIALRNLFLKSDSGELTVRPTLFKNTQLPVTMEAFCVKP